MPKHFESRTEEERPRGRVSSLRTLILLSVCVVTAGLSFSPCQPYNEHINIDQLLLDGENVLAKLDAYLALLSAKSGPSSVPHILNLMDMREFLYAFRDKYSATEGNTELIVQLDQRIAAFEEMLDLYGEIPTMKGDREFLSIVLKNGDWLSPADLEATIARIDGFIAEHRRRITDVCETMGANEMRVDDDARICTSGDFRLP